MYLNLSFKKQIKEIYAAGIACNSEISHQRWKKVMVKGEHSVTCLVKIKADCTAPADMCYRLYNHPRGSLGFLVNVIASAVSVLSFASTFGIKLFDSHFCEY